MATLILARAALAATAILAMTPVAIGESELFPRLAILALPPVPEVQPPFQGGMASTTTASLGPLVRPAPEQVPATEASPVALSQALQLYATQSLGKGDEAARTLPAGIWTTTAEWTALRTYPREAGYARILAFLAAHADWPSNDWLRKRAEEALFGDAHTADVVKAHFAQTPPRTAAGKIALARVNMAENDISGAAILVANAWRKDDFNKTIETAILTEFSALLTKGDHKYRADRLLYKEDTGNAQRIAALAGADVLALAKARSAVIKEAASDALFASVPANLASDPGLAFSAVQKHRRAENVQAASALMLAAQRQDHLLINGDEWWTERRLLARAMLDNGEAATAWRLSAEHSAQSPAAKIEAEFHAGWIALRYLDNPALARGHFAALAQIAEAPASIARAAYWLGRTQEILGDDAGATAFFAKAAQHSTVFYGQLARARLGMSQIPVRTLAPAAVGDTRAEAIRVAEVLQAQGAREIASSLMYDCARKLESESQMAALAAVVAQGRNAALALQVGKQSSQRGFALDELAFPDFGVPDFVRLAGSADKALVYSIVRQESAFVSKASSGAGAKGLMQLMVATARKTAQRAGVEFDVERLTSDPSFNAQLGASHLGTLFGEYDGSYVLTFAAYNAGGSRVKQWMDAYGDPRRPEVDVVDWIEHIPITETRNYVQHIMENLQVYRARFGQQTTLLIEADLRARGGRF